VTWVDSQRVPDEFGALTRGVAGEDLGQKTAQIAFRENDFLPVVLHDHAVTRRGVVHGGWSPAMAVSHPTPGYVGGLVALFVVAVFIEFGGRYREAVLAQGQIILFGR